MTDYVLTPIPWRIHDLYPEEIYATVDGKRFMVADISGAGPTDQDRVNAAFIVKAVNNHNALIEAMRHLLDDKDTTYAVRVSRARDVLSAVGSPT